VLLREDVPKFWRWCGACGQNPVARRDTVMCNGCNAELAKELGEVLAWPE
jgi:hypothetical protein